MSLVSSMPAPSTATVAPRTGCPVSPSMMTPDTRPAASAGAGTRARAVTRAVRTVQMGRVRMWSSVRVEAGAGSPVTGE